MENYFATLSKLNVSDHLERKGQFAYLSWPYAVEQLRLADPAATWEVKRFGGLPFLKTEVGYFVEVAVTVQGVTLSQIHPVLDAKNRPIEIPNSFDINTSIQRCLVKAIALHGVALYVYAGEDLPANDKTDKSPKPAAQPKAPATVTTVTQSPKPPAAPAAPAAGTLAPEQIATIKALLAETGTSLQRLLAFFRVAELEKIPASEFPRVIQTLESAKRRAA